MRHFIDVAGQHFGELTALQLDKELTNKKRKTYWICQCSCSKMKSIRLDVLRSGKVQSCGECLHDLTGRIFGRLKVVKLYGTAENEERLWLCECDCGTKNVIIRAYNLTHGLTQSCGCLQREAMKELRNNLNGMTFGNLMVVSINESKTVKTHKSMWNCTCKCGTQVCVSGTNLINNHTISCGCVKSLGELKIKNIFHDNNIVFSNEYIFPDLNNRRFDFAVLHNDDVQYLIEYHGRQHYMQATTWNQTYEEFCALINRDKEKEQYCLNHNIPLIRIPYWHYNDLCIDDLKLETTTFIVKAEAEPPRYTRVRRS